MSTQAAEALARARCSLEGLSTADAFGQQFFEDWPLLQRWKEERQLELDPHGPDVPIERLIATRNCRPRPGAGQTTRKWRFRSSEYSRDTAR
jgi:hypothetical protein